MNRDRLVTAALIVSVAFSVWAVVQVIGGRQVNPWLRVAIATSIAALTLFVLAVDRDDDG